MQYKNLGFSKKWKKVYMLISILWHIDPIFRKIRYINKTLRLYLHTWKTNLPRDAWLIQYDPFTEAWDQINNLLYSLHFKQMSRNTWVKVVMSIYIYKRKPSNQKLVFDYTFTKQDCCQVTKYITVCWTHIVNIII